MEVCSARQMGNKINSADIPNPMGDNARHCITVNRTISGMCLDRVVAPRSKVTGQAYGLRTSALQALPRRR